MIDVVAASGVVIVQTVWATTAGLRFGHRRTHVESIAGEAALLRRLTELVPVICGSAPEPMAGRGVTSSGTGGDLELIEPLLTGTERR